MHTFQASAGAMQQEMGVPPTAQANVGGTGMLESVSRGLERFGLVSGAMPQANVAPQQLPPAAVVPQHGRTEGE